MPFCFVAGGLNAVADACHDDGRCLAFVTGSRYGVSGAYLKAFTGPASPSAETSLYLKRTGGRRICWHGLISRQIGRHHSGAAAAQNYRSSPMRQLCLTVPACQVPQLHITQCWYSRLHPATAA
jgi:hypothetical protein